MDKRSLWQRKALNGSRLRLLIWGVLAAFLVVVSFPGLRQTRSMRYRTIQPGRKDEWGT